MGGGYFATYEQDGIRFVAPNDDIAFNDTVQAHFQATSADCVVSLCDTWILQKERYGEVPWFPFTPIDHLPCPPQVADTVKAARAPIAYSLFGMEQLKKQGLDPIYWPHAYDPKVFYPMDRAEARAEIGVSPDAFFVAFVGVNDSVPNRKGIPELLEAWQEIEKRYPEAILYMHTSPKGGLVNNPIGGVDMAMIMKTLHLDRSRILLPDEYLYKLGMPQSHLRAVYSAADVFVLPSRGEGFGLPLIEAQACGCPAITTDIGAQAELVPSGNLIGGQLEWSYQSAFQVKPDPLSIVEQLKRFYDLRGEQAPRDEAAQFARSYEVGRVFMNYGRPGLRQMGDLCL
jgi:glycosyltransferase involved in cell wall biosynthesis